MGPISSFTGLFPSSLIIAQETTHLAMPCIDPTPVFEPGVMSVQSGSKNQKGGGGKKIDLGSADATRLIRNPSSIPPYARSMLEAMWWDDEYGGWTPEQIKVIADDLIDLAKWNCLLAKRRKQVSIFTSISIYNALIEDGEFNRAEIIAVAKKLIELTSEKTKSETGKKSR